VICAPSVVIGTILFIAIAGILLTMVRARALQATVRRLRESERTYRELFERSLDVRYQTDSNGIITLITPSAEKTFGFRPDELIGKPMADFYRDPSLRANFLEQLQSRGFIENFETEIRRKDGSFITVSTNAAVRTDPQRTFLGVEGVTRDITLVKKAQREQLLVEEGHRQNQKMEAIGTLAGGIAHDFNNILTAIIGFAEMAQQKVPPDDHLAHDIAGILRSGMRAKELVRHILIFSRKSSYEPTPVDLYLAVKEAIRMIRASLSPDIEIREQFKYRTGRVLADPTEIHQVIINLCTNAAQAMEEQGGGVLTVSLDREELSDEVLPVEFRMTSGPYLRLQIADTGQGIPEELLEKVFDPFFTTREIGKGSGLGLAIVHGIVRRLGGMVTIKSTHQAGTTVTVHLPEPVAEQHEQPGAPPDALRGTEQILFVDDEQVVTDVTCKGLELLGYRVTPFTGSPEALEHFRSHPDDFDLVITDQTMPKMTGGKLAELLLGIRPDIPIIMCTGYSAIMDAEKAGQIGIRAFVMKPFDHKNLASIVRKVLSEQ
jgi:PAS domain S-box-containing protein